MSIEKPLRELVQAELRVRMAPMHKAIARMEERLGALDELADIIRRLSPLTKGMQSLRLALPGLVTQAPARGAAPEARSAPARATPEPRPSAPSRPAQDAVSAALLKAVRESDAAVAPPRAERPKGHAVVVEALETERRCAVIGCKRPARSKGYCSAHYQKLRLLVKTDRRPASWTDDAPPQSAPDVVLPRGRAAAGREREELPSAPPERPVPPPPPTPKVWVRKKGDKARGDKLPVH